jgi:hypothetical protein
VERRVKLGRLGASARVGRSRRGNAAKSVGGYTNKTADMLPFDYQTHKRNVQCNNLKKYYPHSVRPPVRDLARHRIPEISIVSRAAFHLLVWLGPRPLAATDPQGFPPPALPRKY